MSEAVPVSAADEKKQVRQLPTLSKDLFVYAVLVLLVWIARQISLLNLFKAGDDVGYWMGVAGAVMMLLLFSYPLRKHFQFARNWGQVKGWLIAHMVLGIGGPLLILVHSAFRFSSLNAGVALYSMYIVVLSGVVGRFIYIRVNRGLHGEIVSLQELKNRAGIEQEGVRSRLNFAREVERTLLAFAESQRAAVPGWRTHLHRVFVLPYVHWYVYWRCTRLLVEPSARLAAQLQWDARKVAEHRRLARKMVRRYLNAVVRVAQFGAYEWMLSAWHVAHVPFVFLLIISTFVHIFAVHAY
ncbi:MAG: hypothetical protein WCH35_08145 [Comamonadaceae bacterium]